MYRIINCRRHVLSIVLLLLTMMMVVVAVVCAIVFIFVIVVVILNHLMLMLMKLSSLLLLQSLSAVLVAYSRGTGKFLQFPREPLPQKVPAIQYSRLGLRTLPPTVPGEHDWIYTFQISNMDTPCFFYSEMTFLVAKMDDTDMQCKTSSLWDPNWQPFLNFDALPTGLIRI